MREWKRNCFTCAVATHVKSFWSALRFDSLTIKHGSRADPGQLRVKWSQACLLCRSTRYIIHQTETQKHYVLGHTAGPFLCYRLCLPLSPWMSHKVCQLVILFTSSSKNPLLLVALTEFSHFPVSVLVFSSCIFLPSLLFLASCFLTVLSLTFSANIFHAF